MSMSDLNRKKLLKSQQGELDGVETYLTLARTVSNESDARAFKTLAADEGRHAAVFRQYTGETLKPGRLQASAVSIAYRILGKRILYPIIAHFEYAAVPGYELMEKEYPEVESVKNDETRHGDTLKNLLKNGEFNDRPLLPIITGIILVLALVKRICKQ